MDSKIVTCPHCGRKNRIPAAAEGVPRCGNCHQPLPWVVDAGDARDGAVIRVDVIDGELTVTYQNSPEE